MRERRTAHRYRLALPIVIFRLPKVKEADVLRGRTRDISTRGLYFTTDRKLTQGAKLNFSLTLPREITSGTQVSITAEATVVRVEKRKVEDGVERVGAAAVIERFEIIRAEPSTS